MEEAQLTPDEMEDLVDIFRTLKNWRENRNQALMLRECELEEQRLAEQEEHELSKSKSI